MLAKKKEKDVIDRMLDQIDFHGMTAEELAGENGLLKQLTRRFCSRALDAEMDEHLGYKKNDNAGDNSGNSRNGYTTKTVITEDNDTIEIQVPRDRNSTFEPVIIPKHEKRTPLFNDQIISMYSFGMSTRDIQRHLQQVYGVEVSPETISNITESVMADVREWQNRPLEKTYPILSWMPFGSIQDRTVKISTKHFMSHWQSIGKAGKRFWVFGLQTRKEQSSG